MLKKLSYVVTISALAALSLATVVAASGGSYTNFTIANGDPNEEGVNGQTKVQPAIVIPQAMSMLNILANTIHLLLKTTRASAPKLKLKK